MNDRLDETIKAYFSERTPPSSEVKASLQKKLLASAKKQETRWAWAVISYAFIFSSAFSFTIWLFSGSMLLISACMTITVFSMIGAVIITIACRNGHNKGGLSNVVVYR